MASLIFYTDIIINRKNWRIAINKTFEHRSIFLTKRTYAHTRTPPSPYSFLFVFQWPPSLPPSTNVLFEWPLITSQISQYLNHSYCNVLHIFRPLAWIWRVLQIHACSSVRPSVCASVWNRPCLESLPISSFWSLAQWYLY